MSNVLRIALVDPNDGTREALKAMLLGMDTVWLEADCSRYEFFPDVIEQTGPDVGVVSLDNNPDKAIDLIQRPHCPTEAHGRWLISRLLWQPVFETLSGRNRAVRTASASPGAAG